MAAHPSGYVTAARESWAQFCFGTRSHLRTGTAWIPNLGSPARPGVRLWLITAPECLMIVTDPPPLRHGATASSYRVDPERIKTLQENHRHPRRSRRIPPPPADAVFPPRHSPALGDFSCATAPQGLGACTVRKRNSTFLVSERYQRTIRPQRPRSPHSFDKFQRGRGQDTGRAQLGGSSLSLARGGGLRYANRSGMTVRVSWALL